MTLDPDEVGYTRPANMSFKRDEARRHSPADCTEEHCSCHLPAYFNPPSCSLTAREAFVLAWHLFVSEDEELSFEEIGQSLGVTESRARRIYQRASAKIRAHTRVYYPPKPGTDEYAERMAKAEEYKSNHPEYQQNRALLDAMNMKLPSIVDGENPAPDFDF